MVDVPRETRLALFPTFLRRGVVIRVDQYPFLYEGPRDKFLVLLNLRFGPDRPLFCVPTTSRTETLPFPALAMVLAVGTVPFFPLATAIPCREVHSADFGFLAQRYALEDFPSWASCRWRSWASLTKSYVPPHILFLPSHGRSFCLNRERRQERLMRHRHAVASPVPFA